MNFPLSVRSAILGSLIISCLLATKCYFMLLSSSQHSSPWYLKKSTTCEIISRQMTVETKGLLRGVKNQTEKHQINFINETDVSDIATHLETQKCLTSSRSGSYYD